MLQISERVQRVRKHAAVQFDFQAFDSYHVLNLKVVATPPDYLPIECHLSIVHHISIVNAVVESIHLEVDVYDVSRLATGDVLRMCPNVAALLQALPIVPHSFSSGFSGRMKHRWML